MRGDSANDLPPLVADPNVTIHEGKAFTGNIRAGRRSAFEPQTPEELDVPQSERTLFGDPEHPGPVAGPGAVGGTVEAQVVSPAEVMEAARLAHRLDERNAAGSGIGQHGK